MPTPGDFYTTERLGPMQSLTPEKFLIIRAVPLARCGSQLYSDKELPLRGDAGGRIVVDRLPEDVFAPATIASLNGKPITLDHPEDDVTPENYRDIAVGTVLNVRRGLNAQSNLLYGDLVIHDPEAIKAIRDRELLEVSVGYKADYQQTGPGRGRQRNILANHLALVQDGRCGPACRIGDKAYFTKDNAMPRFRDAQDPMNNLHGRSGSSGGGWDRGWDRLPGRSRDESPGTSQGSTGSATGGTARKAERPDKPASLKAGVFSNDDRPKLTGTGQQYKAPYKPYNPAITDDQEEDPDQDFGLGQIIDRLDPPPPGYQYALQPAEDGVDLLLIEDDGSTMSTADRTYRHRITDGVDPILRRMNSVARGHWARTRDWKSNVKSTLYRYKNRGRDQRIAFSGPDSYGGFEVILYGSTADLTGPVQAGARGAQQHDNPSSHWPTQAWIPTPGRAEKDIHELDGQISTGDRAMTAPQRLHLMNQDARRFWAAR